MNKSVFKPAEILKKSEQNKNDREDVTETTFTNQNDMDTHAALENAEEVKSVDDDVILV